MGDLLPARIFEATVKPIDRKSTRLNSSHLGISYAVFCLKKKKKNLVRRSLSTSNSDGLYSVITRDVLLGIPPCHDISDELFDVQLIVRVYVSSVVAYDDH